MKKRNQGFNIVFASILLSLLVMQPIRVASQELQQDSLIGRARDFLSRSMPDNAIPLLMHSINVYRNNQEFVDYANINLAEAYRQKQEYSKGIDLIRLTIGHENISLKNKAYAWNRMAALYNEWGSATVSGVDSTVKYSLLCIELSSANNFTEYLALSQNELGYVYAGKKNFDKALMLYSESYKNFTDIGLIPNAMNVAFNISGVYLSKGNCDSALLIVDSALALADENQYNNMFMRLYLRKSDIYEYLGDFKSAFLFQKNARRLQENFFKDRIELQINEMSAKYDLNLKEQKIAEIRHKNELQRQQSVFLWILVVVLLIVMLFMYLNIRLKRKVRRQKEEMIRHENMQLKNSLLFKEKELQLKNQELIRATTDIIGFNDVLLKLKKELENSDNEPALSIIHSNLNFDNNWEKFRLEFEKTYPVFFIKIKTAFPLLSETDLKLCAFLFLGLKTVEIAEIMCISEASVSKSRNRMRKKLGLENGSDIGEFLSDFVK